MSVARTIRFVEWDEAQECYSARTNKYRVSYGHRGGGEWQNPHITTRVYPCMRPVGSQAEPRAGPLHCDGMG